MHIPCHSRHCNFPPDILLMVQKSGEPPENVKKLVNNGINYQPQLVSRIPSINSIFVNNGNENLAFCCSPQAWETDPRPPGKLIRMIGWKTNHVNEDVYLLFKNGDFPWCSIVMFVFGDVTHMIYTQKTFSFGTLFSMHLGMQNPSVKVDHQDFRFTCWGTNREEFPLTSLDTS